eukprot:TRINITY_DN19230_c0_g1_i1.p1 TRINITY_DN19230_c0_g1~~TRINITY_DN19230_c0_g1_i1.p1  ORF type:complete len:108 (-),score=19.78 TRINITY_DN19230_c0_g1_i1:338-661(-)
MDDPTVKWDVKRYDYSKDQLTPYLKRVGFNPAKDIHFMPCSGLTGAGLIVPVGNDAPWYTGLPFIPYIDSLPTLKRHVEGPLSPSSALATPVSFTCKPWQRRSPSKP